MIIQVLIDLFLDLETSLPINEGSMNTEESSMNSKLKKRQ